MPLCPGLQTRFHLLRILLGSVLLAAASLKLHGFVTDPFSQQSFLGSARLEIATIEVEILLGLWLLSGLVLGAAWMAAAVFFSILASASLYMALTGQRSCACLGSVSVTPWLTFAIDVIAVAALALCRPTRTSSLLTSGLLPGLLKSAAGAA